MANKQGLLPRWLFAYTALRTLYILAAHKDHFSVYSSVHKSTSLSVYLAFLLGVFRLAASRRVTQVGFYFSIAASFLAEGLFFVYGGLAGVYSIGRVAAEVALALFTLAWMLFLYPYYLLKEKDLQD